MTYQLATAKVWDGSQWVAAAGGGGSTDNWTPVYKWTSSSVTVTASSTPHTKGAWTELIASTTAAVDCLILNISLIGLNGNDTATLCDVAIGASGSETAIVSNIAIGSAVAIYNVPVIVYVPSGSRISIRTQSIYTSKTGTFSIFGYAGPNPAGTSTTATVIGSDTATSAGITMSGTNNTYVQLTSSTAVDYQALLLVPSASAASITGATRIFELGTGSAGSETVVSSVPTQTTTAEQIYMYVQAVYPVIASLPAGSRLAVRVSASATTLDACVIATEVVGR